MDFPPSLPQHILSRCHHSANAELGVPLDCVDEFLDLCRRDGIEVLGWELWLVHAAVIGEEDAARAPAVWGVIPAWALKNGSCGQIFGGVANLDRSRSEIASIKWDDAIKQEWLPGLRINVTLAP